jgi:pantoate--beta-alanine ligase
MGALHRGHMVGAESATAVQRRGLDLRQSGLNSHRMRILRAILVPCVDLVLRDAEVDLVWAPSIEAMYPDGCNTSGTGSAAKAGSRTNLAALFRWRYDRRGQPVTQVSRFRAGQKDYQQLRVVTQMAKDLDLPVKVIGVSTVREPDGLALSSRNVYLSATERAVAPMLYRVLKGCAARIKSGENIDRVLNVGRIEFDLAGFALDYLEARHAVTLVPRLESASRSRNSRLMISASRAAPRRRRSAARAALPLPRDIAP